MRLKQYIIEASNPKYPRTYHLPWSEEIHSDDKVYKNVEFFVNKKLAISVKMDGSNVGLSFETVSSRAGIPPKHPSFNMLKQKYATIKNDIPENMIFYGEWLYAVHSIEYDLLDDYLMIFAILENRTKWLSVNDVIGYSDLLGVSTVPFLTKNIKFKSVEELQRKTTEIARKVIRQGHEGIVIRLANSFTDFPRSTAKFVRKGHVQSSKHWKYEKIKVQKLR